MKALRSIRATLVADAEHYSLLVQELLGKAKVSVWIATANVKDLHVEAPLGSRARARGKYISLLEVFAGMAARGVELRLLHGARPSGPFAASLRRTKIGRQLDMRHCPRVHLKMVVVDGRYLYLGSANLTGAGLGAKGNGRRNFEMGVVTEDEGWLDEGQARFDRIFTGQECKGCTLRSKCPKPLDTR